MFKGTHSEICRMPFFESSPLLSSIVFLVPTSVPTWGPGISNILGLQKCPKKTKISIFTIMAIWDHLFNGTGWNSNKYIPAEQFGPFARPRKSQMWSYGGPKAANQLVLVLIYMIHNFHPSATSGTKVIEKQKKIWWKDGGK